METNSSINYLQEVYDLLSGKNFDVYYPGQHEGECLSPYVVIKYDGCIQSIIVSSDRPIYTILFYVPYNQYTYLIPFMSEVKEAMKSLYPGLQYSGSETESVYDEDVRAYTVSIMYYGVRKIEYM